MKKIDESSKAFQVLYGKEYAQADTLGYYYRSMDTLGAFMKKIQLGGITSEAGYKKELEQVGASLSKEEKIIFLGLVGANLQNLTYNW